MVATLWTAVMALLRRNVTGQVAELESSLRDTSLQSVPASTENAEERKSETTASKKSFLSSILQAQQTGRLPGKLRKLPKEVNKRLKVPKGRGRGASRKNMAWLCEKLERRTVKFKQSSCLKVVGAIRELVSEVGCADYAENRDALLLLRGDMLLVKLLLISDRVESNGKESSRRHERGPLLQLQAMCLQTLQDLCYVSRTCLENLCWDNDLLLFLFKSMQAKELFSTGGARTLYLPPAGAAAKRVLIRLCKVSKLLQESWHCSRFLRVSFLITRICRPRCLVERLPLRETLGSGHLLSAQLAVSGHPLVCRLFVQNRVTFLPFDSH